jgi:hypothetical protein
VQAGDALILDSAKASLLNTQTVVFGASSVTGTFNESARNTNPGEANVAKGVTYKLANVTKTGAFVGTVSAAGATAAKGLIDVDGAAAASGILAPNGVYHEFGQVDSDGAFHGDGGVLSDEGAFMPWGVAADGNFAATGIVDASGAYAATGILYDLVGVSTLTQDGGVMTDVGEYHQHGIWQESGYYGLASTESDPYLAGLAAGGGGGNGQIIINIPSAF